MMKIISKIMTAIFALLIFLMTNGPGNILNINTMVLYILITGLILSTKYWDK
jgi:hypothetical protein